MNWEDDTVFPETKKSSAKTGRRLGLGTKSDKNKQLMDSALQELDEYSPPAGSSRVRKTGKWGDELSKSTRRNSSNLIEQERFQEQINSDDDDIPIIPDFDDIQEDEETSQPKHSTISIKKATYKELDCEFLDLQKTKKFGNLGKINLSFLMNKLLPEKAVKEDDVVWTMDMLLQNVTTLNMSEIN